MYSLAALAILALSSFTRAQDADFNIITRPSKGENVTAGETFTIKWSLGSDGLKGPATIALLGGADSTTLESAGVIGHVDNEDLKFEWAVDSSLGTKALYGISITLDSDTTHFQYSPGFHIVAAEGSTSSSSTSTGTTKSTSSQSTSTKTTAQTTTTVATTASTSTSTTTTSTTSSATTSTGSSSTTATRSSSSSSSSSSSTSGTSTASAASATATSGAGRQLVSLSAAVLGGMAVYLVAF